MAQGRGAGSAVGGRSGGGGGLPSPSISSPTTASPATAPPWRACALWRGPGRHSRVRRFRRHAELPPRAGRHASRRQPSVLLAGPGGCEPLHAGHGGRAGTTGHPHAHGGDLPRRAHALRQRPGHRCREARQPAPRLCGPGHPGAGGSRSVGSAGHRCRRRHGGLLHGRHVPGRTGGGEPHPPGGGEPRRLRAGLRLVARGHRSVLRGASVPPHLRRYRLSHR